MNPTRKTLRQFILDNFLLGQAMEFADGDSFLDRGVIDSTGVLELVAFLEDEFGITVEDDELLPANLDSIDNLVQYLDAKRGCVAAA